MISTDIYTYIHQQNFISDKWTGIVIPDRNVKWVISVIALNNFGVDIPIKDVSLKLNGTELTFDTPVIGDAIITYVRECANFDFN